PVIRHVDDVRMLNRGGGARFALESSDRFAFLQVFVRKDVGPDRLDRDASRQQVFVARQIDLAHRPTSETPGQTITRIQQSCTGEGSRSEERRVGKEWRSRGWRYQRKKE